jgi:5-methylcytosine-specific restriction endonuclease McrA
MNKEKVLTQQKRYRASQNGKAISQKVEAQRYLQVKSTRDSSITSETLEKLYEEQNGECYICGCDLTQLKRRNQHLDHIVPLSKGGKHILSNVAWSCANCNFKKSNNI